MSLIEKSIIIKIKETIYTEADNERDRNDNFYVNLSSSLDYNYARVKGKNFIFRCSDGTDIKTVVFVSHPTSWLFRVVVKNHHRNCELSSLFRCATDLTKKTVIFGLYYSPWCGFLNWKGFYYFEIKKKAFYHKTLQRRKLSSTLWGARDS